MHDFCHLTIVGMVKLPGVKSKIKDTKKRDLVLSIFELPIKVQLVTTAFKKNKDYPKLRV